MRAEVQKHCKNVPNLTLHVISTVDLLQSVNTKKLFVTHA